MLLGAWFCLMWANWFNWGRLCWEPPRPLVSAHSSVWFMIITLVFMMSMFALWLFCGGTKATLCRWWIDLFSMAIRVIKITFREPCCAGLLLNDCVAELNVCLSQLCRRIASALFLTLTLKACKGRGMRNDFLIQIWVVFLPLKKIYIFKFRIIGDGPHWHTLPSRYVICVWRDRACLLWTTGPLMEAAPVHYP